ncbi:Dual specificity tyrosine-phosphorylation-regulated kinase 4 [Spathaspora sp. JA1]|nr:Dual specificity tyrosine-phosphorylation-regulated kinase 4 [Spathaspora sp. JA1]
MTEFEDRFSQININKSPTRRKKLYPQHIYPIPNDTRRPSLPPPAAPPPVAPPQQNKHTPAQSPVTRLNPRTPNRVISNQIKSLSTNNNNTDHSRIISYPMSEQQLSKKQFQFSFMRDTWSSQQKKNQSPVNLNLGVRPTSSTSSTSESMRKPTIPPKKRLEQRKSSQTLRTRRLISSSMPMKVSQASNIPEVVSPCKQKVKHHHPERRLSTSAATSTTTSTASTPRSTSNSSVFNRLYTPKKHPEQTPKLQLTPYSKLQLPTTNRRINTISELYAILFRKDPSLFIPSTPESTTCNPPIPIDKIATQSLNIYERGEIIRKSQLYYIPQHTRHNIDVKGDNFGFDDKQGHYIIHPQDHINYRFEILNRLGTGSFGNVIKCKDHKLNCTVAVKIINNNLNWSLQAINEIKIMKLLSESSNQCVLQYVTHFNFRSHLCIVSELLSVNLYTLLEMTKFQGFGLDIVKKFTMQILQGIEYLHRYNIIHCDIKPENIMIKLPATPDCTDITIKLIDFGSACFTNEISFNYIQSRYYRAPEVILGCQYNEKIDIWSMGCVIMELFMGVPTFPGKSELEQLGLMMEIIGIPKSSSILRMRRQVQPYPLKQKKKNQSLLFKIFDINGKFNLQLFNNICKTRQFKVSSKGLDIIMGLNTLDIGSNVKSNWMKFLGKIFVWDPIERSNARELLQESFLRT